MQATEFKSIVKKKISIDQKTLYEIKKKGLVPFNTDDSNQLGFLSPNIDMTSQISSKYPFNSSLISFGSYNGKPDYKSFKELVNMIWPDIPLTDSSIENIDIQNNINISELGQIKTNSKILGSTISNMIHTNIIFIFHEGPNITFIEPDNFTDRRPNIYFYINTIERQTSKISIRLVLHIYVSDDGTYTLTHTHRGNDESKVSPEAEATKQEDAPEAELAKQEELESVEPGAEPASAKLESVEPEAAATELEEAPAPAPGAEVAPTEPEAVAPAPEELSSTPLDTNTITGMKTYTYNPEDIHALLKKVKITNKQSEDDKNGEYVLGKPFGYPKHRYKNIYSQVSDTGKYQLSGCVDTTTNHIQWLTLLQS